VLVCHGFILFERAVQGGPRGGLRAAAYSADLLQARVGCGFVFLSTRP